MAMGCGKNSNLLCTGFVRIMENLESDGINHFNFQAWKVMESIISISRPGKSWNLVRVKESHREAIRFLRIKRQIQFNSY